MKYIVLLLTLLSYSAQAQWYFGSGSANNLTNAIQYKNLVRNEAGSVDPTAVATPGEPGSLYMRTNGTLYVKADSGTTTNWAPLATVASLATKRDNDPTGLTALPYTSWATGDVIDIYDLSATALRKTTIGDFNEKYSNRFPLTSSQIVYVNSLSGSNVACPASPCGDGTFDRPYATIAGGAMPAITDSDINKPYVIALLGSRQVETTNVALKPYVSIVGMGQRASYLRAPGFSITADATIGAAPNSWNILRGFYLGGGTTINWDLQAVGGNNRVFILEDMTIGAGVTLNGRNAGGGDYLEMYNTAIIGNFSMDSTLFQINDSVVTGTVSITNSQGGSPTGGIINSTFYGNVTINNVSVELIGIKYPAGNTLTTVGTMSLDSGDGLPNQSLVSLSGGTTLTHSKDASSLYYNPATPADWSAVPDQVAEALDTLAADLSAIGSGDVTGPASSTDNAIVRFDGTTGKIIQDSVVTISDVGVVSGITQLNVDNLRLDGNTISSTDVNGNILLDPNGTGSINFPDLTASTPLKLDGSNNVISADIALTTDVTGILPIANGGTNSNTALSGSSIMISNGTSIVQGAAGTTTTVLHGNAAGAPTYAAVSLTADVSGILPLANGGTNKNMTAVNGGVVWTDADSMEVIAAGTSGQVLQSNGAAAPSWVTPSSGTTIEVKSANFTAACGYKYLTTNAINVQLPSPAANCIISVKKKDANNVTFVRAASEQIEGVAASYVLYGDKAALQIESDATDWWVE